MKKRVSRLTNEDVFMVYGLIVGMIAAERRPMGQDPKKPVSDWVNQWAEHPSLKKARAIYCHVQLKKLKIK